MRPHRAVLAAALTGLLAAAPAGASEHALSARGVGPDSVATAYVVTRPEPLALQRAALEHRLGRPAAVIAQLEGMDFSADTRFPEADRAAFLLGRAWLATGRRDRFMELSARVAEWREPSLFTEWIAFERALLVADSAGTLEPFATPGPWPGEVAELGRALDAAAAGEDELVALATLSNADTTTQLGRDLAGAALLRRAARVQAKDGDPRPLLAAVHPRSRHASRARHALALHALERGDTAQARAGLEALLADDPDYDAASEVLTALAGQALDAGDPAAARARWDEADRRWNARRDTLERLAAVGVPPAGWPDGTAEALPLDATAMRADADSLAWAASDLRARPDGPRPVLAARAGRVAGGVLPAPSPEDWSARIVARTREAAAADARDRAARELAAERARLDDVRRYLAPGLPRAHALAAEVHGTRDTLDSIAAWLDSIDARLRAVRDDAMRRVERRARALATGARAVARWEDGLRRLYVEGPSLERAAPPPDGYPTADSTLSAEELLTAMVQSHADSILAQSPGHIAGSYDKAWRPGLVERARELAGWAANAEAWAHALADSIARRHRETADNDLTRALAARLPALGRDADSLAVVARALDARLVRESAGRALAAMAPEREGIEYGLAASAWALGVGLGAGDSLSGADALETPEAVAWQRRAADGFAGFLARHPQSAARGDARFRLADLRMLEARRDFRDRMAAWTEAQQRGARVGAPPVLDPAPALALYRALLAEDLDFPRRDAALFHAATLLADQGDDGADTLFAALAEHHPDSPHAQEALLRRGDVRFDARRYDACVVFYARAAEGPDPSLRAIALYKMGWALEQENRFLESADAFRSVLDLYATHGRRAIRADVEDEAETWFVHTLARAGGASAWVETFARIGPRPYERRILMALGQHFRRFERHAEAAAADTVALGRWPLEPDALLAATRLVETWERANRPADARRARLTWAPHFAPGGAWVEAQSTDSLRAAGPRFARAAWETEALALHRAGRAHGRAEDWRQAARLYDAMLEIWPDDDGARRMHLLAGEAREALDDPAVALAHYGAASAGADSIAERALYQRVAVTDAWYRRTPEASAAGRDSLARGVMTATDTLLARFPAHPRAADLTWRTGNLAFAHEAWPRAAADFGRLTESHPQDARAPRAALLRADALYRGGAFAEAGAAYERAHDVARAAGVDSLARRAAEAVPVAWYRDAEAAVAADSGAHADHAARFARLAERFPRHEHAHQAQYRAALAWSRAGRGEEAIAAFGALIGRFPNSEYARDAHVEVARTWQALGRPDSSAASWVRFAQRFPKDSAASHAWLAAADAYDSAGATARGEQIRVDWLARHPDDHAMALEILEPMARRELAALGERPISTLLPATPARATKRKGVKPSPAPARSRLAMWLERAAKAPAQASPSLLAEVRFLEAEESHAAMKALALTQPLDRSIPRRQAALDSTLARYRRAADVGVATWAHAAAFRIGEALVGFGEALQASERPADLSGEDARAYEDVLMRKSLPFHDRGEAVWSELLRANRESGEDPWLARARATLFGRLGDRFYFRPETSYPLATASGPTRAAAPDSLPEPLGAQSDGSEP